MRLLFATAAIATATLLVSSPVFAEAIVYRGIVGQTPVLLELSQPAQSADGKLVGRYYYANKGVDIPLAVNLVTKTTLDLDEEKPCTDKICHDAPDGQKPRPPVGARWHLQVEAGGAGLRGTWTAAGSHKSLLLDFTLVNARPLPADFDGTAQGLTSVVDGLTSGENELTTLNSPYDFIKFDEANYVKSPPKTFGDSTLSYWTDPRTKFAFPRIVSLAGGADIAPANHYLEQQHWLNNVIALECESQVYQGFGWMEGSGTGVGTLGGMDENTFEATYLSPTVMSWIDAGSPFCTGAHPDDHTGYYNLDVRTGAPLDLSRIFTDWVPKPIDDSSPTDLATARAHPANYTWGPDDKLTDFVLKHLPEDATGGDEDCTKADTIGSNLDISFKADDHVVFAIDRMPFVANDCDADLFDLPIADLKPLLTPEAADYFPSLAGK